MVRNRICATESPPPPPDLAAWLEELERLAELGDRLAVISVLRALVPSYQVARNVAVRRPPASPRPASAPRAAATRSVAGMTARLVIEAPPPTQE